MLGDSIQIGGESFVCITLSAHSHHILHYGSIGSQRAVQRHEKQQGVGQSAHKAGKHTAQLGKTVFGLPFFGEVVADSPQDNSEQEHQRGEQHQRDGILHHSLHHHHGNTGHAGLHAHGVGGDHFYDHRRQEGAEPVGDYHAKGCCHQSGHKADQGSEKTLSIAGDGEDQTGDQDHQGKGDPQRNGNDIQLLQGAGNICAAGGHSHSKHKNPSFLIFLLLLVIIREITEKVKHFPRSS